MYNDLMKESKQATVESSTIPTSISILYYITTTLFFSYLLKCGPFFPPPDSRPVVLDNVYVDLLVMLIGK